MDQDYQDEDDLQVYEDDLHHGLTLTDNITIDKMIKNGYTPEQCRYYLMNVILRKIDNNLNQV